MQVKIFGGSASKELSEAIALEYGTELGNVVVQRFSDGEFQPNILESVRGDYLFLVQSTYAPGDNLLELLLMIDAAKRASAQYISAVIPYFGLSRQDRKDKPRVSIGSKMAANILSAAGADRVMTMDLHADQIQGFFDIPVDHLDAQVIFYPYIESLGLEDILIAAPDVGSTKRAREYAKLCNCDMVICDKHRKRANEIASMTLIGDVTDKNVIIVDDIVDTANTLCSAAKLIMDSGAKSVRAFCTHPVLSGSAYDNIGNSVLTELVVTDTIPLKKETEKIKAISCAWLFAKAIRNMHEHKSISSLFVKQSSKEAIK